MTVYVVPVASPLPIVNDVLPVTLTFSPPLMLYHALVQLTRETLTVRLSLVNDVPAGEKLRPAEPTASSGPIHFSAPPSVASPLLSAEPAVEV